MSFLFLVLKLPNHTGVVSNSSFVVFRWSFYFSIETCEIFVWLKLEIPHFHHKKNIKKKMFLLELDFSRWLVQKKYRFWLVICHTRCHIDQSRMQVVKETPYVSSSFYWKSFETLPLAFCRSTWDVFSSRTHYQKSVAVRRTGRKPDNSSFEILNTRRILTPLT